MCAYLFLVEYRAGQEPYLLSSFKLEQASPSLIALSPDGRAVTVATGTSLYLYNAVSGKLSESIHNVHSSEILTLILHHLYRY